MGGDKLMNTDFCEKEYDPWRLLELWESFIKDCEEGYYWDFGEYMNQKGSD